MSDARGRWDWSDLQVDAERKLVLEAAGGGAVAFTPSAPAAERTVRAEVVAALLLGLGTGWPLHPRGLRLEHAIIAGRLDLAGVAATAAGLPPANLALVGCRLADGANLCGATLAGIALPGCELALLDAVQLRCRTLHLAGTTIDGPLRLRGAVVDGAVDARQLAALGVIDLGETRIAGRVDLRENRVRDGAPPPTLSLTAARIDGFLWASGCTFDEVKGVDAHIGSEALFNRLRARSVLLTRARIAGHCQLEGARLGDGEAARLGDGEAALIADGARFEGGLICGSPRDGHRFEAAGEVRLVGAHVGRELSLHGAKLHHPGADALVLSRAEVAGRVVLSDVEAAGWVALDAARIAEDVCLVGARLENPGGFALSAAGAEIAGSLVAYAEGHPAFCALGELRLARARIGNQLNLTGASLCNVGGVALGADGIEVGGDVMLRDDGGTPFRARGKASFAAAVLAGVEILGARLDAAGAEAALVLFGAEVRGDVQLTAGRHGPLVVVGGIDGRGLRVSGAVDGRGALLRLAPGPADAAHRVALALDGARIAGDILFGPLPLSGSSTGGRAPGVVLGCVRLDGARIEGDVNLGDGVFLVPAADGEVLHRRRHEAEIAKQVRVLRRGVCLSARHASVAGALVGRGFGPRGAVAAMAAELADEPLLVGDEGAAGEATAPVAPNGLLDLGGARLATLDAFGDGGWPEPPELTDLDGCTYDRAVVDTPGRALAWITRRAPPTPQPYLELARALRRQGHTSEADRVVITARRRFWRGGDAPGALRWLAWLLDATSEFGYAPGRALGLTLGLVAVGAMGTGVALRHGWLIPKVASGSAWPDAVVFAVGAFLPLLPAGAPAFDGPGWLYVVVLLYQGVGLVMTSILVATLTGLLRRE